jgi:hypothetical protein
MIVNEEESIAHPEFRNHFIQFGISTWTENLPESEQEESIRRAVYNQDGVFRPHGSSEIPLNEMGLLFRRCLELDKISIQEMTEILDGISASIRRRQSELR